MLLCSLESTTSKPPAKLQYITGTTYYVVPHTMYYLMT